MSQGRILTPHISYDPKFYLPSPASYTIWPSRLYDALHAGADQRLRRVLISCSLAVAEYAVGLALALSIGFGPDYVETPAVYLLCVAFGFFMGRARWLTVQIPERIKCFRGVFDTSDTDFRAAMERVCRAATNRWITIPLTVSTIALAWSAVGEYYLGKSHLLTPYVSTLVAPTFPPIWHTGHNLVTKMIIVDFYIGVALAFSVPTLYGSTVGLLKVLIEIHQLRVVPVPSYVASALRPAAQYLFNAATYYAVAVAALTLLYAGPKALEQQYLYLGGAIVLSLGGIACLAASYLGIRLLIDQSRQQVADHVATSYYRDVWPIANGDLLAPNDPIWADEVGRQSQLLGLEKLMREASQETALLYRIEYIVQGTIIQISPTILAIIVVAVFAHDQLIKVFIH